MRAGDYVLLVLLDPFPFIFRLKEWVCSYLIEWQIGILLFLIMHGWWPERYNGGGRGVGRGCKARGSKGEVEENETSRGFEWVESVRVVGGGGPNSHPHPRLLPFVGENMS